LGAPITGAGIGLTVFGGALVATDVGCFIAANYQYWNLQSEMNERLPEGEKLDPLFWNPFSWAKFGRLHKAVLPDSPRSGLAVRYTIAGFALFFSGAALFILANAL
jgi:hypothetical protein